MPRCRVSTITPIISKIELNYLEETDRLVLTCTILFDFLQKLRHLNGLFTLKVVAVMVEACSVVSASKIKPNTVFTFIGLCLGVVD